MINSVNTIAVCGAGTMGSGIAQVAATAGYYTILFDLNETALQKGREGIEKSLQTMTEKGRLSPEEKHNILERMHFTTDLNECIADVVIEAIVEKTAVKVALFNQLAEINHAEVIFATNTSSLSVNEIAGLVVHPNRVVGMHFFNPAPLMKLVEVVQAPLTDKSIAATTMALAESMGKIPVLCKDAPGFIVNRVARHYYLEALRLVEAGSADYATIDTVMEASGFKMGPFKLMDLIGNDINYAVSLSVYEAFHKAIRFRPSYIQQEKVAAGTLGRKTGAGYYQYQ
jgi:3-hydroxybutyryl-CoA dehydrogenase